MADDERKQPGNGETSMSLLDDHANDGRGEWNRDPTTSDPVRIFESPTIAEAMRLADEYTRLINHPNCQFARAALEAYLAPLFYPSERAPVQPMELPKPELSDALNADTVEAFAKRYAAAVRALKNHPPVQPTAPEYKMFHEWAKALYEGRFNFGGVEGALQAAWEAGQKSVAAPVQPTEPLLRRAFDTLTLVMRDMEGNDSPLTQAVATSRQELLTLLYAHPPVQPTTDGPCDVCGGTGYRLAPRLPVQPTEPK